MKTKKDPRHLERIKVMQALFAWDFNPVKSVKSVESVRIPSGTLAPDVRRDVKSVNQIIENIEKIDKLIQAAAPSWPIDKINKIDLSILRLAVYELIIEEKTPPKVIVDEAVELAKEYGSDSSASFVNGSLGKVIEDNHILRVDRCF